MNVLSCLKSMSYIITLYLFRYESRLYDFVHVIAYAQVLLLKSSLLQIVRSRD